MSIISSYVEETIKKVIHKFQGNEVEIISVLTHWLPDEGRRNGNTTRQVDWIIQQLFRGKLVICVDHYKDGSDFHMNKRLCILVLERLHREHDISVNNGKLRYEKGLHYIYLIS